MFTSSISKNYYILKKIRILTILLLIISLLTLLFVASFYITSNSAAISYKPPALLDQLVTSINDRNIDKALKISNISLSPNTDKSKVEKSLEDRMNNLQYKSITNKENKLVVQTSDYIIYNSTFTINESPLKSYEKTVPIMYTKHDCKWYIDYNSISKIFE